MNQLLTSISRFINTEEATATAIAILALFLKLFVNRKVTKLHLKETLVSIPSDISLLVFGFIFALFTSKTEDTKNSDAAFLLILTLIIIVGQFAIERFLDDKLSGSIKFSHKLLICFTYSLSVLLYYYVVFGR